MSAKKFSEDYRYLNSTENKHSYLFWKKNMFMDGFKWEINTKIDTGI